MSLPIRPRAVPQCSACLRSCAFGGLMQMQSSALRQQVRGKKKMPNNSHIITVKLLKDVDAYGRRGSFVPITPGTMRNQWFPQRIAEYITIPEMKRLRLANTPMERDFEFELPDKKRKKNMQSSPIEELGEDATKIPVKAPEVKRMSPTRMMELVDIFIPPRLEFYRQPIIEPKSPEKLADKSEMPQFSGAAGDLLAARLAASAEKAANKPQAIYGSVSPQDVLVAMRAVLAGNEDAAKVVLQESDIAFIDMPELEGSEAGRVKHIGDFDVEVWVKGASKVVRRTVRVIPQEVKSGETEKSVA